MIRDFKCSYANSAGISEEVTATLGLEFPKAYTDKDDMKCLARAIKEHDNAGYCLLPFCRTLEAEALGAKIKLGDAAAGPRAAEAAFGSLKEIIEQPDIDFTKGRIAATLEALKELKAEGETVALELVGPTTVLTSMADPKVVFKAYRKNPELAVNAMKKIGRNTLELIKAGKSSGVDVFIFSDSAGALDILGPKMMEMVVNDYLAGFIREAAELMDETCILMLCPKFAFALTDTGNAKTCDHEVPAGTDFFDALISMKGKVNVSGQLCVKHTGVKLGGVFREVVL